jgi:superfamily II DNA or RNA helicase
MDRELFMAMLAYNPLAPVALSRDVHLVPHQLAALYGDVETQHQCQSPLPHRVGGLLRAGFPVRVLIADETGLGKTIIAGLYLLSAVFRGLAQNIIIVVPKAIVGQWYEEMLYKFGLHFDIITRGDEFTHVLGGLRKGGSGIRIITSIDLIKGKHGQEFLSDIPNTAIDITVIDEAHHIITAEETLRFKISKALAEKSRALLMMSATPFRGYYDIEYQRVLQLLGDGFLYIRRFKDQAVGVDGHPLFPPRASYVVEIQLDPYWGRLYHEMNSLIRALPTPSLTKLVFLKRLSSSITALHRTLKDIVPSTIPEDPFSDETDDLYGMEPDMRSGRLPEGREASYTLRTLLGMVEDVSARVDLTLKELELLRLLRVLTREHKAVVFTEYRATLDRLLRVFEKNDIRCVYVHGGMTVDQRRSAIQTFWSDTKVKVFLATDAAGEGINLQVSPYQVNYDLPWSPIKLEQRFGRIHRYGQRYATSVYNLAVKGTIDDYILTRVMRKLERIAKLLGDWIYDYIGIAVKPGEIRRLVMEERDLPEEEMIRRFTSLRAEAHSPRYGHIGQLYEEAKRVSTLAHKYLASGELEGPNILEILRITRTVLKTLDDRRLRCKGLPVALYRVDRYVVALYYLEEEGGKYLDPLTGRYVDKGDVGSYLSSRVKNMANFYGFERGDIKLLNVDT